MCDKIDIENLIYALADKEQQTVWTCDGELRCEKPSALLKMLLHVYNRFFAMQNHRFLADEKARNSRMIYAEYAQFLAEKKLKPVLCGKSIFSYNKENCKPEKI